MTSVRDIVDQDSVKLIGNYVAGQHLQSTGSDGNEVFNPATGEVCAYVQYSTVEDVNHAVVQARKAFVSWSEVPPIVRARKMNRYIDIHLAGFRKEQKYHSLMQKLVYLL